MIYFLCEKYVYNIILVYLFVFVIDWFIYICVCILIFYKGYMESDRCGEEKVNDIFCYFLE